MMFALGFFAGMFALGFLITIQVRLPDSLKPITIIMPPKKPGEANIIYPEQEEEKIENMFPSENDVSHLLDGDETV